MSTGEGPVTSWRRALPLVAWLGALAAGLALFHSLGQGALRPPAVTDPDSWGQWAATREPAVAVAALLRLGVLALGWYLVATTTLGLVARLLHAAGLVRLTDALSVPLVRRLLHGALGVGLATVVIGAATPPPQTPSVLARSETIEDASAPAPSAPSRPPRLVLADDPAESEERAPDAPVSMRLLADGAEPDVERAAGTGEGRDAERGGAAGQDADVREAEPDVRVTHEVVAGESLWSIASDALGEALGRVPTDAEVVGYWQRVIEGNRAGLANPDDPDLIFPGDEIVLPPLDDS